MKTNNEIIESINKKIQTLTTEEKKQCLYYLTYHESEPMAAAERISELLGVSYHSIFDLL